MTDTALVANWYNGHAWLEESRLDYSKLEFKVTLKIIQSELNTNSAKKFQILDVGCGAGRYGTFVLATFSIAFNT
jgi:hypothetical protein